MRWLRLAALLALAPVLVLLGATGNAYGKGRTTLVVGYVAAGAPVNGARLSAYGPTGRPLRLLGKRAARKTDAAGFFVLVLPGRPRSVRVFATGGTARGSRVIGSLRAIVPDPGLARTVFITPVSTVTAAYATGRSRVSLRAAARKAKRLLGLSLRDPLGESLLGVTPQFDGQKFLRQARRHRGLQRYVAYLRARGKTTSFRATRPPRGILDYLKLLQPAFSAASAVGTIGSFAYDVFKWASGSEQKVGQIWEAVQQMQRQLDNIQASLNAMRDQINDGFQKILDEIGETNFNLAVRPLEDLAGVVAKTQLDFKTLMDNATAPVFSPEVAKEKTSAIATNINIIETQFNQANDRFRNGILKVHTAPAYFYEAQTLLAGSGHFMTPADSAQLEDFASYVLQYQAFAFNLILRWETHLSPDRPTANLLDAVRLYLGFDSADKAKAWVDAAKPPEKPPTVPSSGDLHDELAYLQTIQTVPAHTIVDELATGTGMMWQWNPARPSVFNFPLLVRVPSGLTCSTTELYNLQKPQFHHGEGWCPFLWDSWYTASETQMTHAKKIAAASTGLTDWQPGDLTQARAVLGRAANIPSIPFKLNYWISPPPFAFLKNSYRANDGDQICPPNSSYEQCGGRVWNGVVDAMTVKTIEGANGNVGSCTFGVGKRAGTDCPPLLYALLGRKPGATERYWPSK